MSVRLRPQSRGDIKSYATRIIRLPNVLNVFFIGGPDDFLVHVACTGTEQLRDFVAHSLSSDLAVASTQTHIVFDHLFEPQYTRLISGFDDMRRRID